MVETQAVKPRKKPTGKMIDYPTCGEWTCDDYDYDWEAIGPADPDYPSVKMERDIARYHQPRDGWRKRLQQERDKRNHGDPLWANRLIL